MTTNRYAEIHYAQMYAALQRIKRYQSVASLRRYSERDWGVSAAEGIEMAYENVLEEAKRGLKHVRKPVPPSRPHDKDAT